MSGKQDMLAREYVARVALDSLSKNALIDLVVDLLRRNAGNESLDGVELTNALIDAFEPVARVRGDRVPNVDSILKKRDKRLAERAAEDERLRALRMVKP